MTEAPQNFDALANRCSAPHSDFKRALCRRAPSRERVKRPAFADDVAQILAEGNEGKERHVCAWIFEPCLVNVGHRDLLLPPDYTARYFRRAIAVADAVLDFDGLLEHLRTEAARADRVFLDVDCDVFDPAYFPAVTQPVPFGLTPQQVLRILDAVWSPKVAGVFLSEFEPGRDRQDQCLATLMWLIEYVLLLKYE